MHGWQKPPCTGGGSPSLPFANNNVCKTLCRGRACPCPYPPAHQPHFVAPASLTVAPAKAGAQKPFAKTTALLSFPAQLWIPAFAGMTEEGAGMTEEGAGITEEGAGTARGEMLCLFSCVDGEKYLPHPIFNSSHQQRCYALTRRSCAKRVQLGLGTHNIQRARRHSE